MEVPYQKSSTNEAKAFLEQAIDEALETDDPAIQDERTGRIVETLPQIGDDDLGIDGALVVSYLRRRRSYALDFEGAARVSCEPPVFRRRMEQFGYDKAAAFWHVFVSRASGAARRDHIAHALAYLHRFSVPLVYAAYDALGEPRPSEPVCESLTLYRKGNEHDKLVDQAVDDSFRAAAGSEEEKKAIFGILNHADRAKDKNRTTDAAALAVLLTQDNHGALHEEACEAWWQSATRFYIMNQPKALGEHIRHIDRLIRQPDRRMWTYINYLRSLAVPGSPSS